MHKRTDSCCRNLIVYNPKHIHNPKINFEKLSIFFSLKKKLDKTLVLKMPKFLRMRFKFFHKAFMGGSCSSYAQLQGSCSSCSSYVHNCTKYTTNKTEKSYPQVIIKNKDDAIIQIHLFLFLQLLPLLCKIK